VPLGNCQPVRAVKLPAKYQPVRSCGRGPVFTSSIHGSCCPLVSVIPVVLFATTSLIQTRGNSSSEAVTLFAAAGVARAVVPGAGAISIVLRIPLPERRRVRVPPAVFGRYQ